MAVLTDTNILLRLLQPHHPHSQVAQNALDILRARNEVLNVAPQNLVELWAAATRPSDENPSWLGARMVDDNGFWLAEVRSASLLSGSVGRGTRLFFAAKP
jgi:predicted nucleic acid-binding protein